MQQIDLIEYLALHEPEVRDDVPSRSELMGSYAYRSTAIGN